MKKSFVPATHSANQFEAGEAMPMHARRHATRLLHTLDVFLIFLDNVVVH